MTCLCALMKQICSLISRNCCFLKYKFIIQAHSKINYTVFQKENGANNRYAKTIYDYMRRRIHNNTRCSRANEFAIKKTENHNAPPCLKEKHVLLTPANT